MNIWILNHHAREYGRHPSLSKYLANNKHDVQLFSASFMHNSFEETKEYRANEYYIEENINGYKRIYIKTPKYKSNGLKRLLNQLSFAYRSYKVGKKKLREESTPEVIIGSSVHLFTGVAAYMLSRKAKTKFVFEIRDIWPQTLIDLGALKENSMITKIFKKIESYLYKKADLIISVLPDGHKHIMKHDIDNKKIIYLPNGIDIKEIDNSHEVVTLPTELQNVFKNNKEKFILTYAGSFGVANGLDTIVKTAKELADYEDILFLIIGDGPEKEKLINLANQLNLNNIKFINRIDKEKIPTVLKESDACLFHLNDTPVFKYGLSSNKLFDYMYSAKPMVFAVNTSYDFATESKSGIKVAPENPNEMAKAILKLKTFDTKERKAMGINGRKFVQDNHDYKILANKLMDTLNKFV